MWVFDWIQTVVRENPMLVPSTLIAVGLIIASAIVAFFCRDRGTFLGCVAAIFSGFAIVLLAAEKTATVRNAALAAVGLVIGVTYCVLTAALMMRGYLVKRKKLRAEILRKVQYTLPEKENSYIRNRLQGVLNESARCENATEGKKESVRVDYAQRLLAKVQEAPLTKAERLEMEEVSKVFAMYLKKNRWTVEDVRTLNDLFAYLMKISAKYAI